MGLAWRLVDPRYADDLEGTGNLMHGARWNSPGRGVVYCAENLSLCVLETLVHMPPVLRAKLPPRAALKLLFPDETAVTEIGDLPARGRAEFCRAQGDQWLDASVTLVLRAPSVIVPQDRNLMFNPRHPLMREVKVVASEMFDFDSRLWDAGGQ